MNFPTGKNKVALVTGSAIRVGKCIAETLHKNKYDICVHYNNSSDKAEKLVKKFNERRQKSAFCIQQNADNSESTQVASLPRLKQLNVTTCHYIHIASLIFLSQI